LPGGSEQYVSEGFPIAEIAFGPFQIIITQSALTTGSYFPPKRVFHMAPFCTSSFNFQYLFVSLQLPGYGPSSSVGIATDYGLDGTVSNPGGDEIFRPSTKYFSVLA